MLLHSKAHTNEEGAAVAIGAHNGAVRLLSLKAYVLSVHRLQIAFTLGIGPVVCLHEEA